jgi:hypothetical protein
MMRLSMSEHRPVLPGRGPVRVLVARPRRLYVCAEAYLPTVIGDRHDLVRLAGLFAIAARSPHTVVHVAARGNRMPDDLAEVGLGGPHRTAGDLVLSHHSLALRAGAWPALRRRLGRGRPVRVEVGCRLRPDPPAYDPREDHRDFRDHLRQSVHGDTIHFAGSRLALHRMVSPPLRLAECGFADSRANGYPDFLWCRQSTRHGRPLVDFLLAFHDPRAHGTGHRRPSR